MQHILLIAITIPIVWFAWKNFKRIGRLKTTADVTVEERQQQQAKLVFRIIFCLVFLASMPFIISILFSELQ